MTIENGLHERCSDKCINCEHAALIGPGETEDEIYVCSRYLEPEKLWRSGICPSATHMHKQQAPEQKKRAGQQHQRKGKQLSKKQQESYKRLG